MPQSTCRESSWGLPRPERGAYAARVLPPLLLALTLQAPPAGAATGSSGAAMEVPGAIGATEALCAEVLARHPRLEAAEAATAQLRLAAATAGFRPDPMVGIEASQLPLPSLSLGDTAMAGVQLRVSQAVRWPGTAAAEEAAASARVAMGEVAEEGVRRALCVEVGRSAWRLAGLHQQELILVQHELALGELEAAVQARYGVGEAPRSGLWRLALLRERIRTEHDVLDEQIERLRAELQLLRGVESGAELHLPELGGALPPPPAGEVDPAHPELAMDAAAAEAARARAAAARQAGRPEATLSAGYRIRAASAHAPEGSDLVSLGLTVPVGVSRARAAGAREAAALGEAAAAEAASRATRESLEQRRLALEARWREAWVQSEALGGGLLEMASALRETALADYRLGRADFDALVDAEVQLLELEHGRVDAAVQTRQLAVEWAALTGYADGPTAPQETP